MVRFLLLTTCVVAALGCTCDPTTDTVSTHVSCKVCRAGVDEACDHDKTMWVRHIKHYVNAKGERCEKNVWGDWNCKKGDAGVTLDLSDWNDNGHAHKCIHDKEDFANGGPGCKCCDCARADTVTTTAAPTQLDGFTPTHGIRN